MQNIGSYSMDPDLLMSRKKMQDTIQCLLRRQSNPYGEWIQRLPDISRKLEERIFKDAPSKEDYMNMTVAKIDQQLQSILRNVQSSQQSSQHISSSSAISTMIPTPGMLHSGSSLNTVVNMENTSRNTSGTSMVVQTTNSGTLLPTPYGSASVEPSPSGYQQSPVNVAHGSGGSSMMPSTGISQESSQMMPTPGLNNAQSMPINSERSHGGGLSNIDATMVSHQPQQKQYVGSQNSRILQTLGGQRGAGMRSNMQQKASAYGLPNGVLGNSLGLIGSNVQSVNGLEAPEGYPSTASYVSSPKSLHQHFDRHHRQQVVPTSLSQQLLPAGGHGYPNAADLSDSRNLYGSASSYASTVNNSQKTNSMTLHSKPRINHGVLTHHSSLPSSLQPSHVKTPMVDSSQHMNFQTPQTSQDHLFHSQQQMQNFQSKQFQQPHQSYEKLVQHQHQQHAQGNHGQQLIPKTDTLRQSSTSSNIGGQLPQEHGTGSYIESLLPHATQQLHLSEGQNQFQNNTPISNLSNDTQFLGQFSGSQDFRPSLSQGSQHMLQATESQNDFSHLLTASQPDAFQQHWNPQLQQKSQIADSLLLEKQLQEELHQRINGQDEAQQPKMSSDGFSVHAPAMQSVTVPQPSSGLVCELNSTQKRNYHNQMRWLLLLLHSRRCSAPKGSCQEPNCVTVQELWLHMDRCNSQQCGLPRCYQSKRLLRHFRKCQTEACPVCITVRKFVASHRKARNVPHSNACIEVQRNESWKFISTTSNDSLTSKNGSVPFETSDAPESSPKRLKAPQSFPSLVPKRETSPVSLPPMNLPNASLDKQFQGSHQAELVMPSKPEFEVVEVKIDSSIGSGRGHLPIFGDSEGDHSKNLHVGRTDLEPMFLNEIDGHAKQETVVEKEMDQAVEVKQEVNAPQADPEGGSKSGKPKIKGVSLTELFTPEQIREHIVSLRQWVGQSKAKAEKNQAMERSMSENSCQLCAVEKLTFEPPPIYCTPCGARIKRNAMYYTMGSGDTRHFFCIPCYNEARGDTIEVEGSAFPKAKLEKKRNDEETEEWWVQCDKCEAWQHQICALFNGRRNDGGQAEYTCPNCYIKEIEKGERKPLPQSAVLGAKDLPRTILSDQIEQRLFKRLKQERQERARHLGKSYDEVPGAEALVVRVVSSVDKKLEVKQRFLEIFQEENYPTEYPYKSKVVLLFQKIEGVEVCLFGMYVQEFGSECQFPNQRRVYLSYLDSVKYFRPDIRTVTGEALRTFVYHEILIGYLEYCKKRGFTSCYIWACPPLKGEDYILYCHPEIQKTPKSDKLREWYLAMLRKAAKENIVVELTNLYDHFFVTIEECKAKVTAARLPYFDGDYWPGAAEDMINQLRQEEDGRRQQKKGKTKKTITKRALKAAGQTDLSGNASKDALLMQKLGETICPMKEDFIMVHLQHSCTHCCLLMVSGIRWVCNQCKNFQLCEKCYGAEQRLDERDKHPVNGRDKHSLYPVEISGVPSDTKDKDEILESEFFDTRQAFLSLCQGNHYQYDTLRRAKHSSMMVLYHLHNPTAPAFVTTCNVCHHDIEAGQGWRCEICPDFDVCNSCYQREGGAGHPHKLTNHPSVAERDAQNKEARQKRVVQLRKMLDLLVHASQCRMPHCQYPNCRKVKGLFRHGIHCKTRAAGGCVMCKKMWYLLQLHARACKEAECHVPRCKDLKEHLKRQQQQSDSRRRAAVMEMMRQRAAEVAGGSD
ncbi:histone acetyltransferase HAC1-like isoform X2 [Asparagus officinalis]|uniref:histone acetyltransferase HAC1-like isoform X2 n=1 Tax=Asparagus officinalis TaxID=4686 RepID=UPI00098DE553|nr:histone acetyltransferase HAC1-like isoform X2 [Asparagus officinalis]